MLITIYNNQSKTSFQQYFKENMIIPKNASICLTNALIPIDHTFILNETYSIAVVVNQNNAVPFNVALASGSYSLSGFMSYFETQFKTALDNVLAQIKVDCSYSGSGTKSGVLDFSFTGQSLFYDQIFNYAFGTEDYTTSMNVKIAPTLITTGAGGHSIFQNYTAPNSYMGTNLLRKDGVDVNSWGKINFSIMPIRFWLKSSDKGGTYQPPVPSNDKFSYAMLSFENNNSSLNKNYCFVVSNGNPTAEGAITDNTFPQFLNFGNAEIIVMVCNETNGIYTAGNIYVAENDGTGAGASQVVSHAFVKGDTFGICLEDGNAPYYNIKSSGTTTWTGVAVPTSTTRNTASNTKTYRWGFSQYGGGVDTIAKAVIKNIYGSFYPDNVEVSNFGQYLKLTFPAQLATDLGINNVEQENDVSGVNIVGLSFDNDTDVLIGGDDSSDKLVPYLNLQCLNLPVNSFSTTDTNEIGLCSSKTIASIPRYAYDGSFKNSDNVVYNPVVPNEIKLNNSEEISISQLEFRIQGCDGQYPHDLALPQSYVLEIKSKDENKNNSY
tara:strand:- start:2297 stop:3949 length:1653 start_codon:yes stop_codon:yes gene_type:complete